MPASKPPKEPYPEKDVVDPTEKQKKPLKEIKRDIEQRKQKDMPPKKS